ncbi:hypothetical protein [Dehalococcoides mccartyi]|nr:hypothetical protein [Dehalococcoides mccartyi]
MLSLMESEGCPGYGRKFNSPVCPFCDFPDAITQPINPVNSSQPLLLPEDNSVLPVLPIKSVCQFTPPDQITRIAAQSENISNEQQNTMGNTFDPESIQSEAILKLQYQMECELHSSLNQARHEAQQIIRKMLKAAERESLAETSKLRATIKAKIKEESRNVVEKASIKSEQLLKQARRKISRKIELESVKFVSRLRDQSRHSINTLTDEVQQELEATVKIVVDEALKCSENNAVKAISNARLEADIIL